MWFVGIWCLKGINIAHNATKVLPKITKITTNIKNPLWIGFLALNIPYFIQNFRKIVGAISEIIRYARTDERGWFYRILRFSTVEIACFCNGSSRVAVSLVAVWNPRDTDACTYSCEAPCACDCLPCHPWSLERFTVCSQFTSLHSARASLWYTAVTAVMPTVSDCLRSAQLT